MSDTAETAEPVVLIGDAQPEPNHRTFVLFGSETITALNFCFTLTTVAGAIAELSGSTAGAVCSMIVFLIYGFVFRNSIPSMERFADSAYYQGFILTLFALLVALTGKGGHTITSDGIILKFGLAIWTTFIGMSGRILIIQFLMTAQDEDEKARESITEYVVRLNKEVAATLLEFQDFRELLVTSARSVSQQLQEEAKNTRTETSAAAKTAMDALVKAISQTSTKLEAAVENVANRIAHLEIPTDAVSNQIRKVADGMAEDLGRVRLELDTQASGFANILRSNVEILEGAKTDLNLLRMSLGEVNRAITEASNTTNISLAATLENLAASAEAVRGVEQLGQTSAALAAKLTALSSSFDQKSSSYAAELDRVANGMKEVAKDVESGAVNLSVSLANSAEKLTAAIKEVRQLNDDPK